MKGIVVIHPLDNTPTSVPDYIALPFLLLVIGMMIWMFWKMFKNEDE